MKILLADRQDITRAGMIYVLQGMEGLEWKYTEDKAELMLALKENDDTVVVLDYTSFDINDADELLILQQRFTLAALQRRSECRAGKGIDSQ